MPRIVIVGGGISGLALAYRLEQRRPDLDVLVLERDGRVGGKIHTLERDGFRIELGPNGFLDSKPFALDLCRELGLSDRLTPASEASGKNRFLFLRGKLHKLPASLFSFLASGVVSWKGKLRILTERWRRPRLDRSDESIESFATRRVGAEVAATLGDAFVTGVYAGDPTLLSVQSCFPRVVEWEQKHGSVLRGFAEVRKQRRAEAAARGLGAAPRQQLWSFREGLGLLIETLRQRLRRPPAVGVVARQVAEQQHQPFRWRLTTDDLSPFEADAVVLTCPAYEQAAILRQLDPELAGRIDAIRYTPVVVAALGYRSADVPGKLDGFGYLTPQRDRLDVLGVQWCSSIYPGRAPEGMVLVRALCGGWNRADILDWDDAQLLQAVRAELGRAMCIKAEPVFHHLVRWQQAIPQYHLGHRDRVAWIEQRLQRYPGLDLGGNAYRGVALNDCIEQAGLLAEQVLGKLAR
jgi:oxygen-dependent protoporphyrinogen oxidase